MIYDAVALHFLQLYPSSLIGFVLPFLELAALSCQPAFASSDWDTMSIDLRGALSRPLNSTDTNARVVELGLPGAAYDNRIKLIG